MTKIYYVGAKGDTPQGETAFSELTGITWRKFNESHDVDQRVATRMLQHPDVFSDKSPEEREEIERQRKALLEQQRADAANQQAAGGMAALLASLPPGTTIKTPDGTEITIPGAAAAAPAVGLQGASSSSMASRLAAHTGAGENGEPTTDLNKPVEGAAFGQGDQVQETKTGAVDASNVTLAPGSVVNPAPGTTGDAAQASNAANATANAGNAGTKAPKSAEKPAASGKK